MMLRYRQNVVTAADVLARAIALVEQGTLKSDHGDWCPWCAIAQANGELDTREYTVGETLEMARDLIRNNVSEGPEDQGLVGARIALNPFHQEPETITRELCLEILAKARAGL